MLYAAARCKSTGAALKLSCQYTNIFVCLLA
nr:MAG TPA: hypothetical protein [Caudoviricetes sp.]